MGDQLYYADGQWWPSQLAYTQHLEDVKNGVGTGAGANNPAAVPTPDPSKYNMGAIDPTKYDSYNLLKKLATSQGPSDAAQYSLKQNILGRQDAIDASSRETAGSLAQARSGLAARGGIGAGAGERLALQGANNNILNKQGAYRSANSNMLDILKQDALNKNTAINNLANTDLGLAQNNQQTELNRYKMDLDKWAADRQATAATQAAKSSGNGGGSVICSELLHQGKISKKEWIAATRFGMSLPDETFAGYLIIATPLVKIMKKSDKFSNLFIGWAKALAEEKPNRITRILMPVATFLGSLSIKAQKELA